MSDIEKVLNVLALSEKYDLDCSLKPADCTRLMNFIDALQTRIDDLETQRWIPVSEKLPEVDQDVLVFDQRGDITIDYLVALNREGVAYYTNSDDGAVCWMPLPEPPIVYGKVCEE